MNTDKWEYSCLSEVIIDPLDEVPVHVVLGNQAKYKEGVPECDLDFLHHEYLQDKECKDQYRDEQYEEGRQHAEIQWRHYLVYNMGVETPQTILQAEGMDVY